MSLKIEDSKSKGESTKSSEKEKSLKLPLPTGEIPSAEKQRQIITSLEGDEESAHVYCIAKQWYENWQKYVGLHESCGDGKESSPNPGPLTMDPREEEERNTYIDEKIWKKWLKWYGLGDSHQLDRRNWASDDKQFEVCVLSPYSGVVQHPMKTLDISEVTGYIELQLKRLLGVSSCRETRLWMCERQRSARFNLLLDRGKQLCQQDQFEPKKDYILALELRGLGGEWPTHVTGEPTGGDITERYRAVTEGSRAAQYWEEELSTAVQTVFNGISAELNETVAGIVSTSKCLTASKERDLSKARDKVHHKLKHINDTQHALDTKLEEANGYETKARDELRKVKDERDKLEGERKNLEQEVTRMEEMNRIQEARVRLDIGGHVYTTSTLTLTRDPNSMLAAMFSGRHALKREPDGSFFIDRDGTHFRYILNFLRDGGFREGTLPTDRVVVNELITEAEFYQLKGLIQLLEGKEEGAETKEVKKPHRKIALRK